MSIKYGEVIKRNKYLQKVYANVRYEKFSKDDTTVKLNHHLPTEFIDNLKRIQLCELDVMNSLDNETQERKMQGSGWNLQGFSYLKTIFIKQML